MSDPDDTIFCDDPLQAYLAELARIPPLDRTEEVACIQHVIAEDEIAENCRKRLVEANLQLVVTLAERHHSGRVHILDVIQKGNEGLLQATQSLTDCLPGSFSTHAEKYIKRALIDAANPERETL
jgi:RNA polymerase primary sigma factor